MIVVATSGANDCLYCIVAHGAILRIFAKNPLVADQVAANYRKADITPRQKAMLAFALKVALRQQRDRRRGFRGPARAWILRRGHLGHRRDRRVLRVVEPNGEPDQHAAQRRVLPARARAEEVTRRRKRDGRPEAARRVCDCVSESDDAVFREPREHALPAVLGVRLPIVVGPEIGVKAVARLRIHDELAGVPCAFSAAKNFSTCRRGTPASFAP